jgi:hypothetical protein
VLETVGIVVRRVLTGAPLRDLSLEKAVLRTTEPLGLRPSPTVKCEVINFGRIGFPDVLMI